MKLNVLRANVQRESKRNKMKRLLLTNLISLFDAADAWGKRNVDSLFVSGFWKKFKGVGGAWFLQRLFKACNVKTHSNLKICKSTPESGNFNALTVSNMNIHAACCSFAFPEIFGVSNEDFFKRQQKDVEILNQQKAEEKSNCKQTVELKYEFSRSGLPTEGFLWWRNLSRRQHLANKKQSPQRSTQKEAFKLERSNALWIISRLFRFYQENSTGKWFIKNSTEDNKVNVLKDVATIAFNPSVHSIFFCWLNRRGVCSAVIWFRKMFLKRRQSIKVACLSQHPW